MATVAESLDVRPARAEDTFIPFGSEEEDNPEAGEIVYVSNHQVRTRRWTWRQSEIGKIQGSTADVLFPIDGFTDINKEQVEAAAGELAEMAAKYFGAEAQVGFIDKENRVFIVK
jgi:DNA/RNA-binding domain of Phe-tRNA-synthetase-like protein